MHVFNKRNIIKYYNADKITTLDRINEIISRHNKYTNLEKVSLINFINFIPLPSFLMLDHTMNNINYINNMYYMNGIIAFYLLPSNISVPNRMYSPIPFTFPYTYNNNTQLINSNVYYFEIVIDTKLFREEFSNMNVSIGFGSTNTDTSNNILGWTNDSIGYNSFDGNIICYGVKNQLNIINTYVSYGDTLGAGIIYDTNINKIFFTLNGNIILLNNMIKIPPKILNSKLIPMIGINYPAGVSINYGDKQFKYNYMQHVTPIIVSMKNNLDNDY